MKNILKKSMTLSFYEMKARNQSTYLGFFWYFLEPLIMFTILFYVKRNIVNYEIENFIPYLFIGVIMVHFFIVATTEIMSAVVRNYEILNSKKIEPEVFIYSIFFTALKRHIFEALLVSIILMFFGYYYGFLYIFIVPFYALFVLGVGQILCVLSTKIFDATYLWRYLCQILWFILPIYYLADMQNFIFKYNPIYYFINLGRKLAFDLTSVSFKLFLICFLISIAFYFISRFIFNNQKYLITERIK